LKRHVDVLMKLGNDENDLEEMKGYTFIDKFAAAGFCNSILFKISISYRIS